MHSRRCLHEPLPRVMGLESTYPPVFASTLCGACTEVCPVKIPITEVLVRLRTEARAELWCRCWATGGVFF